MKNIILLGFSLLFSQCCLNDLCSGEKIPTNWNGRYVEDGGGDAYINVGIKEVVIRGVTGIPSGHYQLEKIIQSDNISLKVWLAYNGSYLSMNMQKDNVGSIYAHVFLNDLVSNISDIFPNIFLVELRMVSS